MHPNTLTVQEALRSADVEVDVREFEESTRTAREAADALGCPVGAIANSLVFLADGEPILVLTSGDHRVDTDHLAGQIGAQRISRASAEQVRAATGQPIGGVAPIGHPQPVRTFIDEHLATYEPLWASAGTPRSVFATTYDVLLRVTLATPVSVTA